MHLEVLGAKMAMSSGVLLVKGEIISKRITYARSISMSLEVALKIPGRLDGAIAKALRQSSARRDFGASWRDVLESKENGDVKFNVRVEVLARNFSTPIPTSFRLRLLMRERRNFSSARMRPRMPSSMCLEALRGTVVIELTLSNWLRATAALPELQPAAALRRFSGTPSNHASTAAQRRRHRDPYALAQARARKAANISRQAVLSQERTAALGDPVRGIATPFVRSFDTAGAGSGDKAYLKHFLEQKEVDTQLEQSSELSRPRPAYNATPQQLFESSQAHERRHRHATEAIARIIDLQNSNAYDRIKVNTQRCVDTFGRHNTDKFLPPKPKAISDTTQAQSALITEEQAAKDLKPLGDVVKRAGPDTGSSEVQIAILTAKIKSLADFLEARGRKDKVGKRDLRLLVHRRAKLLKYLRRKERGGPRWQRCVEMLGLTDGTWKGEITL